MWILKQIFYFGPLIFAFGFIMPLTAEVITRGGLSVPFDMSPLWVGFGLAAIWGSFAQITGRWI